MGTAIFVGRLLYEKIYLVKSGSQLIGYEFVHVYPWFFFPAVACYFLSYAWLIVALILALSRRVQLSGKDWVKIVVLALILIIDYLPI